MKSSPSTSGFLRPKIRDLLLIAFALLLACSGPDEVANDPESGRESELQFEGFVQHLDLEGGAWVIESKDGTTYDPRTLPDEYKEEGLPVSVWANRLEDQVGIRMVGPIISIKRIERR